MHTSRAGRRTRRDGFVHPILWGTTATLIVLAASTAGAFQLQRTAFSSGAASVGDGTVTILGTIGEAGGVIGPTADSARTLSQGFWFSPGGAIVDVGDTAPAPPAVHAIAHAAPNPFPSATAIAYSVASDDAVRLRIFDVSGRVVRTLVDGPIAAGVHRAAWDGRDDAGRAIGSGVYYVRIQIGEWSETRKVMKLR